MAASRGPNAVDFARWHGPLPDPDTLGTTLTDLSRPVVVVRVPGGMVAATGGTVSLDTGRAGPPGPRRPAAAAAGRPRRPGVPAPTTGCATPTSTGAMANGIGSAEIVEAMGRAGMLGFFGAAGLSLERVERPSTGCRRALGDRPYGFNLIHSPNEPALEAATVDLLPAPRRPARRGVGVPRPDAAGRPLPRRRHPPRAATGGSSRRTASSPRCRGSRWRRKFLVAAAGADPARTGRRRADHRRAGRAGRAGPDAPTT